MNITKVTKKDYEEIETDELRLNKYRRMDPKQWEHWMGDTHQWIDVTFCDFLEEAYQLWRKESK